MSLDAPSSGSPAVHGVDDMVAWFRAGEKRPDERRCGMETEKLGVQERTGLPAPLMGDRSIAKVLEKLARDQHGELLTEHGTPIGITLARSSIALEPGGQLELSGEPTPLLGEACAEVARHLEATRRTSQEPGVAWLAVGYRPFGPREGVPWLSRGRYELMKNRLTGKRAHDMMQMTASVQASFDFTSEEEAAEQVACATAVSPVVAAIFANSPLENGAPSGYQSLRYRVWQDVDQARCGLSRQMLEPGFTYRAYVEWALDVPLVFVRRQNAYHDAGGRTFRDLMREGFLGEEATLDDFADLLSTLFPEVRLKRVIEVRGADAVDARTTGALPCLWLGLLYDRDARQDARALIRSSFEELVDFQTEVGRHALFAKLGNARALDLGRDLVRLADEGLKRLSQAGMPDARSWLDPVREILEAERTGADRILEVHARTGGDVPALIEAMRYQASGTG